MHWEHRCHAPDKPDTLRIHEVTFAHARITAKQTGQITGGQYEKLLTDLMKSGVLKTELPARTREYSDIKSIGADFSYGVLLAKWQTDAKKAEILYGDLAEHKDSKQEDREKANAFLKRLTVLFKGLTITYPDPKSK